MSNDDLNAADRGSGLSDQLGAFFSERAVRDAVMTATDEAKVRERECPKCGDKPLARLPEHGDLSFWHCIGCGCMFCVGT